MSRIATIKLARKQERDIIVALKKQITNIVDTCSLDEEKMARRIQVALKSEYGRINGLINLLSAVCKWPAEQGDGASVATNQLLIEQELGIDLMLLEDINSFKGYHTFHTDELEIMAGVPPQYENYSDHCTIFMEDIGFERVSSTIDPVKWENQEARAKVSAKDEVAELRLAVEKHNTLVQSH